MNITFTNNAFRVLTLRAKGTAQRNRHSCVCTHHMLLGIAEENQGGAAQILKTILGDDWIEKIRRRVASLVSAGTGNLPLPETLHFTPRAASVLEYAAEEATALDQRDVATEHLLLGFLREGLNTAAQVLVDLDIAEARVDREIARLYAASQGQPLEKSFWTCSSKDCCDLGNSRKPSGSLLPSGSIFQQWRASYAQGKLPDGATYYHKPKR